MHSPDPINKIELECQVLCTALRQSLTDNDPEGMLVSAKELNQLFPDLCLISNSNTVRNYYQALDIAVPSSNQAIATNFFKTVRQALRNKMSKEHPREYQQILDAGFILRKPRLRLSHDLFLAKLQLIELHKLSPDVSFDEIGPTTPIKPAQPIEVKIPLLIELLKGVQFIGEAEVQALIAQTTLAPEVPLERLIIDSSYVTPDELNSLKLAQMLLEKGAITMPQFQVAMYDERNSGIRMAESLQIRGWLPVEA